MKKLLFFMPAEFLCTAGAGHISIGVLRESFRMQEESDFPDRKQNDSDPQKAPCIKPRHEEQGREHHREIPVVDPAGYAAPAFEEKHLEGTEEQDADDVGHREQGTKQKHEILVQDPDDIQSPEDPIEQDPCEHHECSRVIVRDDDFRLAGFLEVLRKLFLASGTSDR